MYDCVCRFFIGIISIFKMIRLFFVYFIIVFGVTACGSRKSNVDISKQSSNKTIDQSEKQSGSEETKSGSNSETETKNDIKQVEITTVTNTKFDASGNKTEETTTKTTKDLTDKSTKIEKKTVYYRRTIGWTNERTLKIKETVNIKLKSKQTERVDIYVYLFWGLLGLNVIAGIIFHFWHRYSKFKK